jgi:hypothetical protein
MKGQWESSQASQFSWSSESVCGGGKDTSETDTAAAVPVIAGPAAQPARSAVRTAHRSAAGDRVGRSHGGARHRCGREPVADVLLEDLTARARPHTCDDLQLSSFPPIDHAEAITRAARQDPRDEWSRLQGEVRRLCRETDLPPALFRLFQPLRWSSGWSQTSRLCPVCGRSCPELSTSPSLVG